MRAQATLAGSRVLETVVVKMFRCCRKRKREASLRAVSLRAARSRLVLDKVFIIGQH